MPVVNKIQNSFTSGELGPLLRGRTDIANYYSGAAKLRNVLVIPQGAVTRRPGLEFIDTLPTSGHIKLIPFVFSADDHYLLVLTTNLMKVYKDGVVIEEIPCSITDAQIDEVTWAQSYSTLLLFHQDFNPKAFIRQTETTWVTNDWEIINTPTANFTGSEDRVLVLEDAYGSSIDFADWVDGNTITNVKAVSTGWLATDVGKFIRTTVGGYAKIVSYTSDTVVSCTVLSAFTNDLYGGDATTAAKEWSLEVAVWSATKGYPSCGTFYQGRLWMANSPLKPNTIWGSIVNNEDNFQNWLPSFDDNGIEAAAGGSSMTAFHTMFSGKHLFILSNTGEYYVPVETGKPITPTTTSLFRNSSLGSEKLPAYEVSGAIVFLRSGGKSLLELNYNFAQGSYASQDLALLSSHLLDEPLDIAYRKQTSTDESDYILVVNADGTLSMLCTLREQSVNAWTQIETDGKFYKVGVDGSDMYFAVERIIDGNIVRSIEKFNSELLLDSGVHKVGNQFTTVSGLTHLIGEEVQIVLDNTIQPTQIVTSDTITLERAGDECSVGLNFPIVDEDTGSRVFIETMPIEDELSNGTTVGGKKRLIGVTVMLDETSHIVVNKNKVPIRLIGVNKLNKPVPKVSSNISISGILGWDDEIAVSIGQTLPLSMTLLGIAYKARL